MAEGWQAVHDAKVGAIAARVRELVGRGEPVHIHKGGVHHVVPLPNDPRFKSRPVDVSTLNEILHIDPEKRVCVCEPGVTFAQVLEATLTFGLMPAVVPELEGITVGGAVAGCSIESTSYRYGGFHDNCIEYEVVSGTGDVVKASPETDPLTFGMIHGSYGTLGILTRLTFKLIPAKRYVRVEYRRLDSVEAFHAEMMTRCREGDYDFVDGIVHGPKQFVLCLGKFVAEAPYTSSYRWLDIFYKSTLERQEDYLTVPDYCFRYDADCHWLTRSTPPLEWKPVRFALGKFVLGSTNLIKWSGRLAPVLGMKKRPDVVVDVFIPSRNFKNFYNWYEKDFQFFPLWVVPYRIPEPYPWLSKQHANRMSDNLAIDCAVYGKPNGDPSVDWSHVLEEKIHEFGGLKTLISRNHYTPERFWEIYNRENYDAVKQKLDPHNVFKNLYDKFSRVN